MIYVRTACGAQNQTHLRVHGQQSVSIFLWRWALQGGEAASVVSSSIHADVDVSLLVAPARVCWRGQRALGGAADPLASRRPLEVRAAIASRHLILILIRSDSGKSLCYKGPIRVLSGY